MERSHGFAKSNFKSNLKVIILLKNSGQATIEAVLLVIVLIGAFMFATNKMKEKQILQNFTTASVGRVKTMTEYGTWREACKPISGGGGEKAANCHPNSINRSLSSAPQ